MIDKGSFGQVFQAADMKCGGRPVAIKISRNTRFDIENTRFEVRALELLMQKDPQDKQGIVQLKDHFVFRGHMVLVFELLGLNLYKYI